MRGKENKSLREKGKFSEGICGYSVDAVSAEGRPEDGTGGDGTSWATMSRREERVKTTQR